MGEDETERVMFTLREANQNEIRIIGNIRYRVFCEEKGAPCPEDIEDNSLLDEFDLISSQYVFLKDDTIVGCFRVQHSKSGLTMFESIFQDRDWKAVYPEFFNISKLAILKPYRGLKMFLQMIDLVIILACEGHIKALLISSYPDVAGIYKKIGFEQIGNPSYSETNGCEVIPLVLTADMARNALLSHNWLSEKARTLLENA